MARTATQTAGRRTAAPPPEAANIYEEVWEAVTAHNPSFAAPGERESDQGFFKRLTKAVSDLPPDVKMSPDAEAWYDTASRQFEAGSQIDEPPGFSDEQGQEQEQEQEEEQPEERAARSDARNGTTQPSPAQTASRSAGAERLRQYREQKAAEQAGGGAGRAGGRRGAPAPAAPATGRRGSTQAAPAPTPAPRRGAAQQQPSQETGRRRATPATPAPAAPAPRRSTAPANASRRPTPAAAADDTGTSIARFARLHIIANPNVTLDDLIAAAQEQGYNPTRSTMAGNLTFMRNAIDVVKETGHWRD